MNDAVVRDIRDGPPEEYWDRLRAMLGPVGLITYWYLGRAVNQDQDPGTMRLRRDMRNPAGGILASPLAIAAPETGGWPDREVVPAPVAYSLHIFEDAADVAEIRIARSTVRRGRTMGFSRSVITDAARPGRVIAVTTGIGVTLGDAPPGFRPADLPPGIPDTDELPPLHVVFGARRDADGWRLPALAPRLASTSASLHLGPIQVAFEAAAMDVAAARAGTDALQAEDWDVHFVAPGTGGPFLVSAEALAGQSGNGEGGQGRAGGPGGRIGVRLTLVDEGRDRRVVAAGVAVYRIG